MSDVNKVSYGKPKVGGAISVAPLGSPLPKDAKSDLEAVYKNLGYVSEDGLTNANSPDADRIKAWGGDTVLVVSTEKPDTFEFTLIETVNVDVLKVVYGEDNVVGDLATGITVTANADQALPHVYVIDMTLKTKRSNGSLFPTASSRKRATWNTRTMRPWATTLRWMLFPTSEETPTTNTFSAERWNK